MPDDTRSQVVLAVLSSLKKAEKACIVGPNRAITVVVVAVLSSIQDSCENNRQVNEDSERKELHFDLVMRVGRAWSGVKGYLAMSSRAVFIRRLRHP
jgi:hypothetical protein